MVSESVLQTSLVGRVSNYPLPVSKALLPLFEAVVNSIHAIEELGRKDGRIDVIIERVAQGRLIKDIALEPITNFTIKDNGIGFNDDHYNAFLTSDSTFKIERGGKGIGRFAWLKAFQSVSISSNYFNDEEPYQRRFNFELTEKVIHNLQNDISEHSDTKTEVKLIGFRNNYRKEAPKTPQTIENKIIEHCLFTFLKESPPVIRVIDETLENGVINLNDIFRENIHVHSIRDSFKCKSQEFELTSLRLYSMDENVHTVHLCAQEREVENIRLSKKMSSLKNYPRIQDKDGKLFTYMGYISGVYLDRNVNSQRTKIDIQPEASDLQTEDDISVSEILDAAVPIIETYLNSYLSTIAEESYKRTVSFIQDAKPQYRPLLSYRDEKLKRITPGLSDSQLDLELYKLYVEVDLEIKEQSADFLDGNLTKDVSNIQQRKKDYGRFIEEANAWGKSKLVEYIIHRKVMLDLFEKRLEVKPDGKYYLEKDVHEIIFPLRKTSDEIPYDQQNLWIIDEKLAYHKLLASDLELSKVNEVDIQSDQRPDIVIFDNQFVFVGDEPPFSSVTIIEFKRPMRKDYSETDNPIAQVYGYVDKIRSGKANDKSGRPITIGENLPFYAYIICDITPKIRTWAKQAGIFTVAPNNDGYFGYNPDYKTYMEIISFQKLVSDAKKRNAVLFDQLNLKYIR